MRMMRFVKSHWLRYDNVIKVLFLLRGFLDVDSRVNPIVSPI